MADPIAPALAAKYTINKEDIEGMMKSGLPGETVVAVMKTIPTHAFPKGQLGWLIEVARPIYGEEYVMHSFVSLNLVQQGPGWVEEQQRIIDRAFENARKEHPKAMH